MWTFQISGYPENKSCKMDTVREIKPSIAVVKAAFNNVTLFTSKLDLNLRNKLVKR
jgi:hypothetical protein